MKTSLNLRAEITKGLVADYAIKVADIHDVTNDILADILREIAEELEKE